MTSMKKVIRPRSKNVKLPVGWNTKGQPLNTKGGNTSVSYIGVVITFDVGEEHKHYIIKSVRKAL
ncbi:hypothetical protein Lal_00021854 [Lupinus albus]|nr:hypothetical protein Lal_00021854 [Lupinus albus]